MHMKTLSLGEYKNKEWLEQKYLGECLSLRAIAEACSSTSATILSWLKKFNIAIRNKADARFHHAHDKLILTYEAIEFIEGHIMGDAYLYRGKRSTYFTLTSIHREYAEWVKTKLEAYGLKCANIYKQPERILKTGYVGKPTYEVRTKAYEELNKLHDQWYQSGKKVFPSTLTLTPVMVQQWFMDDGSCANKANEVLISVQARSAEEGNNLKRLFGKAGIKVNYYERHSIRVAFASIAMFYSFIGDCPVECFRYKWRLA